MKSTDTPMRQSKLKQSQRQSECANKWLVGSMYAVEPLAVGKVLI